MSSDSIRSRVQQYYDAKIQTHGVTPLGVDWNSSASQRMRFEKLLEVVDLGSPFTIDDFGCGYGALADYLEQAIRPVRYFGFDISRRMLDSAAELHAAKNWITFVNRESEVPEADYTVASGIFNVKLDTPVAEWEKYVLETLQTINELSRKGFAFNLLTKYSAPEFMRPDLYYADPLFLFDYCQTKFSRRVALLHDYPLYEFTMLVRRDN
jgi:SAM-dependent methyltransferase